MARSPSKSLTPTVANPPDSEIPCPGSRKHGRTPSGLLPHVRFTKDGGGRSASQHLPGPFPPLSARRCETARARDASGRRC
jgi:hypothetical protein